MRGKKQDVYEGGIKVPGFAHWPGKIKPGKVKIPIHIVDWLPTLAHLVGHEPKIKMSWDGIDQSPAIFENSSTADREMYWVQKNKCRALRYGDWKIVSYSKSSSKVLGLGTLQSDKRSKRKNKYRIQIPQNYG